MKNTFVCILFLSLLAQVSCTKKESPAPVVTTTSPEEIVKSFVQMSGQAKEVGDKNKLMELCTGGMKEAFLSMNDEQFRLYYLNGNLSIREFKVLSASREKDRAVVHYQVVVENRQGTDVTKESNEREVNLVEAPSGWLIESVRPKGTDKLVFSKGMVF